MVGNAATGREARDALSGFGRVRVVRSKEAALEAVEAREAWRGFVVEADLPDGDGFDVLTALRAKHKTVPALALVPRGDARAPRRAVALRAGVARKPLAPREYEPFALRCVADAAVDDASVAEQVDDLAARHGLSPREVALVRHTIAGTPRAVIQGTSGVTANTLKTQVRSLLRKLGAVSLDAVALQILRAAAARHVVADRPRGRSSR